MQLPRRRQIGIGAIERDRADVVGDHEAAQRRRQIGIGQPRDLAGGAAIPVGRAFVVAHHRPFGVAADIRVGIAGETAPGDCRRQLVIGAQHAGRLDRFDAQQDVGVEAVGRIRQAAGAVVGLDADVARRAVDRIAALRDRRHLAVDELIPLPGIGAARRLVVVDAKGRHGGAVELLVVDQHIVRNAVVRPGALGDAGGKVVRAVGLVDVAMVGQPTLVIGDRIGGGIIGAEHDMAAPAGKTRAG